MNRPIKRVDFVRNYLEGVFAEDLHAKRVESLANGALGVMTSASLAVSIIGQSLAQARGLLSKHAIKQVDRLLSNPGFNVWELFAHWVPYVLGATPEIVVALDIGTTKVCTLVAEIGGEERIEVLGMGVAPSTGMRKGVVVDIPATAAAIRASVREAEKSAGVQIATVYVGITGAHIESLNSRVANRLLDEHPVEEDVRRRRSQIRSGNPERERGRTLRVQIDQQDAAGRLG